MAHASFRIISTASKSLPPKDWLGDEHANMFFTLPAQPMAPAEEAHLLLQTGCAPPAARTLLAFAERYRARVAADAVQKNRRLGTRALLRIARRVARFPGDAHALHALLARAVLAEFLPATEAMNLQTVLEETGVQKRTQPVSGIPYAPPNSPPSLRPRARAPLRLPGAGLAA